MTASIQDTLNTTLRDACLAMYLDEVVTNDPTLAELGLTGQLKTPEDLYAFFLIDPLVEPAVETSRGAQAVSSLQQYINGIIMGVEPGYNIPIQPQQLQDWDEMNYRYPLWAANKMLESYPEAYIDPTLRWGKSGYFRELEQTINQTKINADTVGDAVLNYLSRFESVANLKIINGYITSHDMGECVWYFIGKPRTEMSQYYWRSVDMRRHADGSQTLAPGAWSDWEEVELPVVDGARVEEDSIRPVFFNNRLYVVWAEQLEVTEDTQDSLKVPPQTDFPSEVEYGRLGETLLSLKMIYRRYDGTWSTPFTYAEHWLPVDRNALPGPLHTIAFYDVSTVPERLIIGMYSGFRAGSGEGQLSPGTKNSCAFMRNVEIDQNFAVERLFPTEADSMKAETTDANMGLREKYIRAVYHFTLVGSGKFEHPERKQLVAQTSLYEHTEGESSEKAHGSENYQNVRDQIITEVSDIGVDGKVKMRTRVALGGLEVLRLRTASLKLESSMCSVEVELVILQVAGNKLSVAGSYMFQNKYTSVMRGEISFYVEATWESAMLVNRDGSQFIKSIEPGKTVRGDIDGYLKSSQGEMNDFGFFSSSPRVTTTGWLGNPPTSFPEISKYAQVSIRNEANGQTLYSDEVKLPADIVTFENSLPMRKNLSDELLESYYVVELRVYRNDDVQEGSAAKRITVKPGGVKIKNLGGNYGIPPHVASKPDSNIGTAEYLEFIGSQIEKFDTADRKPIRMNTLFVPALINKGNQGLEHLLQWSVQELPEPPMGSETAIGKMDFNGANGLYFWELFFHLPFLASYRLNLEQNHAASERWLKFVFDPAQKDRKGTKPPFWNVRPLLADTEEGAAEGVAASEGRLVDLVLAADDPDTVAAAYPIHYRKAIFLLFVRNMIDRGDLAYRQLTPDSVNEARQWYIRASDALGPTPETTQVSDWTPIALSDLASATNSELRSWSEQLGQSIVSVPLSTPARIPHETSARMRARSSEVHSHYRGRSNSRVFNQRHGVAGQRTVIPREPNPHFRPALNEALTESWGRVATRLYNLRHSLTIDGKPMVLPLFAPPMDPKALLASRNQSGAGGRAAGGGGVTAVPPVRFAVVLSLANRGVDTLIQFGSSVLSYIERKEQAEQTELQQTQLWEMSDFILKAHDLNIEAARHSIEVLKKSRELIVERQQHYTRLYNENISATENAAQSLLTEAKVLQTAGSVSSALAPALRMVPNAYAFGAGAIGGMACGAEASGGAGGSDWGGIPAGIGITLTTLGQVAEISASSSLVTEDYRRRRQEWELQRNLATLELAQLDEQMIDLQLAEQSAKQNRVQVEQEQIRQKAMLTFLTSRFAGVSLYQWMLSQMSALYFQAYDCVLSLCLSADAAWQYETGDYASRFVQPGGWNDTWRGMLVGENLKLNLMKMEAAYIANSERELEITKTVSLKRLLGETEWQTVLDNLQKTSAMRRRGKSADNGKDGKIIFSLNERLFNEDYPGHYLRRIKSMSISLPALVGPYQDVRAMLTQTSSYLIIGPSLEAVESMMTPDATPTEQVKLSLRPGQQIALSTGIDDNGMFVLNFSDERFLPFEYTGAVSSWELEFPRVFDEAQQAMLASLNDVIVHVRYTARYGGDEFKKGVSGLLGDPS
ncbi:neuraminidase-like domain-containing protein [Bradyrhizobium prioriisuperbiae]|uniref:Tc toxin subunit A-related protein n=1 Tax=Bradyrhizobium prioriisuperbiae TaxID=2854389 RepID=UPI0028ED019F|nr:neuraminidase-like domain-containing protein [Bradyrhizobium prioritasuperba]